MTKLSKTATAIFLCLIMIVFTACGSNSTNKETQKAVNNKNNTQETSEVVTDDGITMEETVVFDKENVKITATRYEGNSEVSSIFFDIENNSDRKIEVYSDLVEINGILTDWTAMESDLAFYKELEAGESAEVKAYINAKEKSVMGIEKIADVEFDVNVLFYDEQGKYKSGGSIEEHAKLTTSATDYVQTIDDSGEVVYEDAYIKLVNQGFKNNSNTLYFYCESKYNERLDVFSSDVIINSKEVNGSLACNLSAHGKCFFPLRLNEKAFDNPDEVKNVEFTLSIASHMQDMIEGQKIIISF